MIEVWKKIIGFERYQVSNLGRVRSFCKIPPIILSQRKINWGYMQVALYGNKIECKKSVHRLVLEAFKPRVEGKTYCNHIDGNKINNHIDNLEWVTCKENVKDNWKKSVLSRRLGICKKKKEKIPYVIVKKFSESEVKRIRKLRNNKVKLKHIAKFFNITCSSVSRIHKGRAYKEVPQEIFIQKIKKSEVKPNIKIQKETKKMARVNTKGGRTMTEEEKKKFKESPKTKLIVAVTLDPENIDWAKEWAAKRDRSLSWSINHFIRERRNRELAEKHLGQRVVR